MFVRRFLLAAITSIACTAHCAFALIFVDAADETMNVDAPPAPFRNSGWNLVGTFGAFEGTPIGPSHFISAAHTGVRLGTPLVLNGVSYPTVASFKDPSSDLQIWKIAGSFPAWASLYRKPEEIGRIVVMIGRGSLRGPEIRVNGDLRGWRWRAGDGRIRWGINQISNGPPNADPAMLYATFDYLPATHEAIPAGGDSSAPLFIFDGNGWKLAGITFGVACCYSETGRGTPFSAALVDARGLYYMDGQRKQGTLITGDGPQPSFLAATRISARQYWIDMVLGALRGAPE